MSNIHQGELVSTGSDLDQAERVMILCHGRGATAQDILSLSGDFQTTDMAYIAPTADNNTWYPFSFLAPLTQNEPYLSAALARLQTIVNNLRSKGFKDEKIYFGGFSQGACLTSEFLMRNPSRYGGALIFSGGVIGPQGTPRDYPGSFEGMPVFLGCSDVDAHVPKERVNESTAIFKRMGASVTEKIYPGMPHTIVEDEIEHARNLLNLK